MHMIIKEGKISSYKFTGLLASKLCFYLHTALLIPLSSACREIKILKRLKHKNIVNLVETFEDVEKQKLYVVLEYCVGGLQEMLDKAPHNKFPGWQAHR